MGLFDGYQFGDTAQGGLIDRLMQQLGVQGQYQPSAGYGPDPMNANAAMPAQQNAPIAVGDYQMPRIGGGFPQNTQPAPMQQNQQSPLDSAQWPAGPMGAPMQANAQMQQPIAQQAPAMAQPQQQPGPPAFLQQPSGSPLATSFQSWANTPVGNPMAALANGISSLSSGRRTDPTGQADQNMRDQYRYLVPILGEQKATLAVLNPTLGQKMVETALAGKQYAFTTLPDGTVLRQDAHAGTAEPVYQGAAKPTFGVIAKQDGEEKYGFIDPTRRAVQPYEAPNSSEDRGTVTGPDGKPIQIPAGVDRNTFVKEVSKANAKAAAGELTEAQAKSTIFANKMELAEKNLKGLDDQYTSMIGAGGYMRGTEYLPGGNAIQSEGYQKFKQARDNFITALLRQESGAAISASEFSRYEKELFPQPGDSPAVVVQKREARRVNIEAMKKGAGPGYKSPTFGGGTEGGTSTADPLGIR